MRLEKVPAIWLGLSGLVYMLGILGCMFFATQRFSLGFVIGGGLVLINAWASRRRLKRTDFTSRSAATASVLSGFFVRLAVLGACLYAVIKYVNVDPVGLVAGLSVAPIGLLLLPALIYLANRRPEEA